MKKVQTLVVDAGNTALKYMVFSGQERITVDRIDKDDFSKLRDVYVQFDCEALAITSVRSPEITAILVKTVAANRTFELKYPYQLPFSNSYHTPESLGKDRLCNVAAAYGMMRSNHALTIDIGTCIKMDLIEVNEGYIGGSISPGIQLRYNALNDYTDNLPRLTDRVGGKLTGMSTVESIQAGVLTGMKAEINQMIAQYESKYPSLTIFVTGGDSAYFELVAKNDIFAVENLTLIGLYQIYIYQDQFNSDHSASL